MDKINLALRVRKHPSLSIFFLWMTTHFGFYTIHTPCKYSHPSSISVYFSRPPLSCEPSYPLVNFLRCVNPSPRTLSIRLKNSAFQPFEWQTFVGWFHTQDRSKFWSSILDVAGFLDLLVIPLFRCLAIYLWKWLW